MRCFFSAPYAGNGADIPCRLRLSDPPVWQFQYGAQESFPDVVEAVTAQRRRKGESGANRSEDGKIAPLDLNLNSTRPRCARPPSLTSGRVAGAYPPMLRCAAAEARDETSRAFLEPRDVGMRQPLARKAVSAFARSASINPSPKRMGTPTGCSGARR